MAGIWSSDCKSHSKVEWKTELACWSSSPEFTHNLFYPLFAEAELLNEGDLVSYLASQRLISEIHRCLLHGEKKSKSAVFACLSLLECILVVLLKKKLGWDPMHMLRLSPCQHWGVATAWASMQNWGPWSHCSYSATTPYYSKLPDTNYLARLQSQHIPVYVNKCGNHMQSSNCITVKISRETLLYISFSFFMLKIRSV